MRKRGYIIYNKRSCRTGREIFDTLKRRAVGGILWRRSCNAPPKRKDASVTIRWGNSIYDAPGVEINSKDAVRNTTEKGAMMRILSECDKVRTPKVYWTHSDCMRDGLSNTDPVYIRGSNDKIRYTTVGNFRPGDKYALKPIDKDREFRVHRFKDKTVGVIEKIPMQNSPIWKDNNCHFRRIDLSRDDKRIKGVRPIASAAVDILGLDFGGVDVLMKDGKCYVNEVNSAPGLNNPNVERWVDYFEQLINEKL